MIRITKVIREGEARRRRRSTGLTVETEFRQPPQQNLTTDNTSDATGPSEYSVLRNIADSVGQAAVSGNLSRSIGFSVSSVVMVPPLPPPSDPTWSKVASEEVSREEPAPSFVSTVARLQVMVQPESSGHPGLLIQQPSVVALDEEGNCVSVGVTSLTLTAKLKGSNSSSVWGLQGNTTVAFEGCWANYTDLSINTAGENITMVFTLNSLDVQSRTFTTKINSTGSTTAPTAGAAL
ncbi:hypothetical protein COCON_G00128690 [Conger conger]|uniref:Uncharacterized protein n=1 Tax=Conger conger TaxID=82655 RepID=A0A9Q1DDE9_CONCO|nr:hypothetical protein COCON_G00128690 [Conger conger]